METYPDFQFWSNVRTYFFLRILWNNSTGLARDLRQQLSIFGAVSILKSNYSWRLTWLQLWHPTNRFIWLVIYQWERIPHESSPICCLPWKSYMEFSTCLCYMLYWSTIVLLPVVVIYRDIVLPNISLGTNICSVSTDLLSTHTVYNAFFSW